MLPHERIHVSFRYNTQQLESIMTAADPLLIIAGSGSGNSFTLVECFVFLLSEKG
jgi:superfamily I DNA/RNA helicase